jgi:hypothetical protein
MEIIFIILNKKLNIYQNKKLSNCSKGEKKLKVWKVQRKIWNYTQMVWLTYNGDENIWKDLKIAEENDNLNLYEYRINQLIQENVNWYLKRWRRNRNKNTKKCMMKAFINKMFENKKRTKVS